MRQRIVLAEDHAAVAEQLRMLLSIDYEVAEVVRDGRALLEAVKALRPDAIVADIGMPVTDGLAASRAILHEYPEARIVFVTVWDDPSVIRRALSPGALGYVWKADAGAGAGRTLEPRGPALPVCERARGHGDTDAARIVVSDRAASRPANVSGLRTA